MSVVSSRITFLISACLPQRNLCTPERAAVERSGAGYHIVLPANLELGASIPTRPDERVVVTHARGTACWDLKVKGVSGCSGPSGNYTCGRRIPGSRCGRRGLDHEGSRRPYLVLSEGHSGTGFKENEGFYEIDLEIK